MTASNSDPVQDPVRYLADVFDELTAATTHDASVHIAAQAAHELADADGLCLFSAAGDSCLVALAQRQQIHTCDLRNSGLYRTVAPLLRAEPFGSRTLWGKEDFIALPTGEQQPIGVVLIVPLAAATGQAAVGFFWQPGRAADSQGGRRLELLAKAWGLAACTWQHVARQREQQRIAADLQHGLRNNLALMRSIIRRSHETAESAEHFALHLEARMGVLARMQGTLGAVGGELEDIVRTELTASAVPEHRYLMQGPAVRLHAKAAESMALAAHELATNSLKFGALGASGGHLAVTWAVVGGELPRLRISWVESGVTIASVAPRRRGFGQELIECTLPYELGAVTLLTFSPGGLLCEIEIPLDACTTSDEPAVQQAAHGGSR